MSGWPDIERVVIGLIRDRRIAEHVDRELPGNLQYRMPFVLVERAGGDSNRLSDHPTVMVDVLTSRPDVAWNVSQRIRALLAGDPLAIWPIDWVEVVGFFQPVPAPSSAVGRWSSTFRIGLRRIAT